jgi:hypothetical protein
VKIAAWLFSKIGVVWLVARVLVIITFLFVIMNLRNYEVQVNNEVEKAQVEVADAWADVERAASLEVARYNRALEMKNEKLQMHSPPLSLYLLLFVVLTGISAATLFVDLVYKPMTRRIVRNMG